jgi:hypothetical protein
VYRESQLLNISDTRLEPDALKSSKIGSKLPKVKVCSRCDLPRTYVDKHGKEKWQRHPKTKALVCKTCYDTLKRGGSDFIREPMTVTGTYSLSLKAMKRSTLHKQMLLRMRMLIVDTEAPVCYLHFTDIMTHGTFRNHIRDAIKDGDVKRYGHERPQFYSLKGYKLRRPDRDTYTGGLTLRTKFTNQDGSVSVGQEDLTLGSYLRQIYPKFRNNFLYKILRDLPLDTTSIHNIRLSFPVPSLYPILSANSIFNTIPNNYGLKTSIDYAPYSIDMVIQRTNTVAVTIGCTQNPIPLIPKGLDTLSSILEMISGRLYELVVESISPPSLPALPSTYPIPSSSTSSIAIPILSSGASQSSLSATKSITIAIPHYYSWIVKMWHLNIDSMVRYSGKAFEIEYAGACEIVKRIYVKQKKHGKFIRVESQEYPNKAYGAMIDNILHNKIGYDKK